MSIFDQNTESRADSSARSASESTHLWGGTARPIMTIISATWRASESVTVPVTPAIRQATRSHRQ